MLYTSCRVNYNGKQKQLGLQKQADRQAGKSTNLNKTKGNKWIVKSTQIELNEVELIDFKVRKNHPSKNFVNQ